MRDLESLQAIYSRHWEAFLRDVDGLDDTPEGRATVQSAISAIVEKQDTKAIGIGAFLAEHWETIMPKLLGIARTKEKQDELIQVFEKLLLEQVLEISRVLGSSVELVSWGQIIV